MQFLTVIFLLLLICLANAACSNAIVSNARPQTSPMTNQNSVMNNSNRSANAAVSSRTGGEQSSAAIPVYTYEVVKTYKHDPEAFTQGLTFHQGFLYEGTGSPDYNGTSSVRKIDVTSGLVKQKRGLDPKFFGEGLTILNNKIYQLTWNEKIAFVYDVNTLEPQTTLAFTGEGWGLTNDGTNLIMSDGSHILRVVDPNNFRTVRTINVFNNGKPLTNINELEFIKGEIWANIWHSEEPDKLGKPNYIARINPEDGKILGWVDLGEISPDDVARNPENTLNGIAYDTDNDRIFVTGKQWKKLFEIKIKPKA